MRTVIELPPFERHWRSVWKQSEYSEFVAWISDNPKSGDVITGSGGVRKIRWTGSGKGKRGGARIIFFSAIDDYVYLMTIYAKGEKENIDIGTLKQLKELLDE